MPRPKNSPFNNTTIPGTRAADPDKVLKSTPTKISESVLSVTIGQRLAKRCPPVNIKGDRPE